MFRRTFLIGVGAALASAACGGSPAGPGPITPTPTPTPTPPPTPSPTPPPTLGITRILSFGDSMTAGTVSKALTFLGLDAGLPQSYPYKLQTLLTQRYSAQTISVFNAGIAGRKATQDNKEGRFNDRLSEAKPDLAIILEGANDLNTIVGSTNEAITLIVGAIEDMVRESQRRGVKVMVATLPEQRPGQPNTANAALVPRFNTELRTMAQKKGAILVDLNAMFPPSLIGQDGLHPTEEGYEKFAEIFLEAIRPQFETPAAADPRFSR
jgi:lysophospholipase L1-like esterase